MPTEALATMFELDIAQHRLRPLDVALARFLAERDTAAPAPLLWLGALLSRQLADGHLCLDLTSLDAMADEQQWPFSWRNLLRRIQEDASPLGSPLIADADGQPAAAPLVCDGNRLYLRRYWNHECHVAAAIRERLGRPLDAPLQLADELQRLFPSEGKSPPSAANGVPTAPVHWQKIACALAARSAFTVITGGPGTGKTTTVVRLLGLLQTLHLREHARPLRIRLAAPTGKAAERLNASIATQLAPLDVDAAARAAIPTQVDTLHRLLGSRPDTRRFRHDRGNPLHLDLLVIDEASMIDLEMMSAVLSALPTTARLILLGDKDQLSSVEAGAVLGDLCRRAQEGHYDDATAQWLKATTAEDIAPFVTADASALDQQVAMLRRSHRFDATSGIGRLATAVNMGDAAAAQTLLTAATAGVMWEPSATPSRLVELAIDGRTQNESGDTGARGHRHYLEQLRRQRPADDAGTDALDAWARDTLQAFNGFQLLCALRRGPFGVEGLNRKIAESLQVRNLIESRAPGTNLADGNEGWYEGRPVMVTRNDYSLGLSNGDVGICLRFPDDHGSARLSVAFLASTTPGASGGTRVRRILPSRLNDVTTAYAMTVHKSQGSEFEHTLLALPPEPSPILTRELLYTGITRARRWFTLAGNQGIVELAIRQRTRRYSGLAERLSWR